MTVMLFPEFQQYRLFLTSTRSFDGYRNHIGYTDTSVTKTCYKKAVTVNKPFQRQF